MDRSAATLSEDSSANVFSRTDFRHIPGHLFGHYFYVSGRSAFRTGAEARDLRPRYWCARNRDETVPAKDPLVGSPRRLELAGSPTPPRYFSTARETACSIPAPRSPGGGHVGGIDSDGGKSDPTANGVWIDSKGGREAISPTRKSLRQSALIVSLVLLVGGCVGRLPP